MAKIDVTCVDPSEVYSDGAVEQELLHYVTEAQTEDFTKILREDKRWPVFYHLTPMRENILNWYDFRPDCTVLEIGAGMGALTGLLCDRARSVTAVELTSLRGEILYRRHQHRENLSVRVGNFNRMEFSEQFDYITLIGVLEYAPGFTAGGDPADFLKAVRRLLKPDGKLLIAIENRYGLKYWCGANEDHTGKPYSGINGFEDAPQVRTYAREELADLLRDCGLSRQRFFYPMPDYKFPQVLYSDAYLPKEKLSDKVMQYYLDQPRLLADERAVYRDVVANGAFPFLANSFFVECGGDEAGESSVVFASFTPERKSDYRVVTVIRTDGTVEKHAATPQAVGHLRAVYDAQIHFQAGLLAYRQSGAALAMDYVDAPTLETELRRCLRAGDRNETFRLLELFYDAVRVSSALVETADGPVLRYGFLDMTFANCFVIDGALHFFDQEWVEKYVPPEYLLFRAIRTFYAENDDMERCVPMVELLHTHLTDSSLLAAYEQRATQFLLKIMPLEDNPLSFLDAHSGTVDSDFFSRAEAQLCHGSCYFDQGAGFTEEQKFSFSYDAAQRFSVCCALPAGTVAVRFDPLEEHFCILRNLEVVSDNGFLSARSTNAIVSGAFHLFRTTDPQVEFSLTQPTRWVSLEAEICPFDSPALLALLEVYLDTCQRYDAVHQELIQQAAAQETALAQQEEVHRAALTQQAAAQEAALAQQEEVHRVALTQQAAAQEAALARQAEVHRAALTQQAAAQEAALARQAEVHRAALTQQETAHKAALARQAEVHRAALTQQETAHEAALARQAETFEAALTEQEETAADLQTRLTQQGETLAYYQEHYLAAIAQREDLKRQLAHIQNCYAVISNAACWKMTKPLRVFLDGCKAVPGLGLVIKGLRSVKSVGVAETWRRVRLRKNRKTAVQQAQKTKYTPVELNRQRGVTFSEDITFSILVPLYNTEQGMLKEMITSVQAQTYGRWELCLADGSDEAHGYVGKICQRLARQDRRIRYHKLEKNQGISENTNACIAMATGTYFGLLDHDDLLHPAALFEVMTAICLHDADLVYTDETTFRLTPSDAYCPHFKPDFAPDTLRSLNYICHFLVFRRSLLEKIGGGFRPECNGSQDYDLLLRLSEQAQSIIHVPEILYYWRASANSTAANIGAKPYIIQAAHQALTDHLERCGMEAVVEDTAVASMYRIRYALTGQPLVSILIPNKDHVATLRVCVESILEKSTYPNYELIIIENNSTETETFAYYETLKTDSRIRVVTWKGGFNYPAINNLGAEHARGEYFLLLNNDIEVMTPDWIQELLMFGQREDVGAVGAKLYYPDGRIQHAGVILGIGGVAGHAHKYFPHNDYGYMGRLIYAQNLSAVTGACMLVPRRVYEEVKGLDPAFAVAFNDVDLCMRIRQKGYQIVFTPFAEMVHHESLSRGFEDTPEKQERFGKEIRLFESRWGAELAKGDPFYNPHFTLTHEDFSLRETE